MKLLKLSDNAYNYYRENVKGNKNIAMDQARRKLTRNVLMAKEVKIRNRLDRLLGKRLYHYGNMDIIVQFDRVIHIKNIKGGKRKGNWKRDEEKYIQLTKELGIEDSKF